MPGVFIDKQVPLLLAAVVVRSAISRANTAFVKAPAAEADQLGTAHLGSGQTGHTIAHRVRDAFATTCGLRKSLEAFQT